MYRNRRILGAALGCLTLVVLSGCATEIQGTAVPEGEQSTGGDSGVGGSGAGDRPVMMLGDLNGPKTAQELGAPFDPCNKSFYQALGEFAPAEARTPTYLNTNDEPDLPPLVICKFHNSDDVGITTNLESGEVSSTTGDAFNVYVSWGEELGPLGGAQPTDYNGKPGLKLAGGNGEGDARCDTRLTLDKGTAGVIVQNRKFPDADACAVARSVTEHVTTLLP